MEGRPATLAKTSGFEGLGVNDTPSLDAAAIQKIHAAGLKVHVWTIDKINDAKRLLDLGVDGLITNRPGWLKSSSFASLAGGASG